MNRIRCVVERITFQSPDTGYSVLKVSVKGYQELVTVVGNLADAVAGIQCSCRRNPKACCSVRRTVKEHPAQP